MKLLVWVCSWRGIFPGFSYSNNSPAGGYLNGAVIVADGGRLQVRPSVF